MNIIHLVAGAAVELLLVLVQVCDLKFSSTLVAFEAVLFKNTVGGLKILMMHKLVLTLW